MATTKQGTIMELRKYLLSKSFIKKATNYEAEQRSNSGDIVLKIKSKTFIVVIKGFLEYDWEIAVYHGKTYGEPNITILFQGKEKKWFPKIAETIEFYAK